MKFKRPRNLNYPETVRFHGHDGPFLALGYILGRHVVKIMKPRGIMDLRITVQAKAEKPFTCMLDGLQCSTFATLGKGNLLHQTGVGDNIVVKVEKGRMIRYFRMTTQAWDICFRYGDLAKAARKIRRMPVREWWSCHDKDKG
ncbi:MAG: formylmethanofuran dehydrogenase subunit E family protein [candidate division WOR-3 bacterium]|nr:MAG: formylmethanofuran dehydrogenase subunit E family protein [candidate division WOR-3 bacterium]